MQSQPNYINVEKIVHASETSGSSEFVLDLPDTYRQVRKIELLNANLKFESNSAVSEFYLEIKELSGNFDNDRLSDAFCQFSRDPSNEYMIQNSATTYFTVAEWEPANALPGVSRLSLSFHDMNGDPVSLEHCHLTFRVTYTVRRMSPDMVRLSGRLVDGHMSQ